jgi:hypothetical protein
MKQPILGDISNEVIDLIYTNIKSDKNKYKIRYISNTIIDILFADIKPYLYSIISILVLLFLINCFNFYYYIKLLPIEHNITDF